MTGDTDLKNEAELESLIETTNEETSVLLSSDVLGYWMQYEKIINENIDLPAELKITEYWSGAIDRYQVSNTEEIFDLLNNDLCGINVKLEVNEGPVLIHNDVHANLAVCVIGKALSTDLVRRWDKDFLKHAAVIGVGIGQPGVDYLCLLLDRIIARKPQEKERFSKIKEFVGRPSPLGS